MDTSQIIFLFLLFIVAFLYSSVGHGGASGYLALMGFYHFAPEVMKPSALIMNIIVSLMAFTQYVRTNPLNKKLFLLLIAGSIPAAFLGARIEIDAFVYKKILAVILLFPVLRLLGVFGKPSPVKKDFDPFFVVIIGIVIGFLSGMIGIGGGIILSPIILFMGWEDMKKTATISSLFIFLNSISGLISLVTKGVTIAPSIYLWVLIAVIGGIVGSWYGSKKFENTVLKKILGVVLLIASVKLLSEKSG
ncbi:sulfite exporter TauE/SafE family protein [soil metagenome]